MINIKGLNKAKVLMSLYNASKVQGMGFLAATERDMTEEEAQDGLAKTREETEAIGWENNKKYLRSIL